MDRRPASIRSLQSLGLIVAIGLLTGFLTSRGQTYLPGSASQFANSYAVWLTASFLVGLLLPSRAWAIAGGVLVQFAALAGYYLTAQLLLGAPPGGTAIVAFWAIGGIVGGPVVGLAGFWWRRYDDRRALAAAALVGALYLSEGLYILLALGYGIGYAFLAVGVVLTTGLADRRTPRVQAKVHFLAVGVVLTTGLGRGVQRAVGGLTLALPIALILYVCYRYGFGFLYNLLTLR